MWIEYTNVEDWRHCFNSDRMLSHLILDSDCGEFELHFLHVASLLTPLKTMTSWTSPVSYLSAINPPQHDFNVENMRLLNFWVAWCLLLCIVCEYRIFGLIRNRRPIWNISNCPTVTLKLHPYERYRFNVEWMFLYPVNRTYMTTLNI